MSSASGWPFSRMAERIPARRLPKENPKPLKSVARKSRSPVHCFLTVDERPNHDRSRLG